MIRLFFCFATACFMCDYAPDSNADQDSDLQREFLKSLELFDNAKSSEDFLASAKVLEGMVSEGACSGAVFYNLGNAYFRAGQFGRAILNYRKAKPYRPRDPLLEANLQQAILSAPGRLTEPTKPWWLHVLFWTEYLSYPTRVMVALGTFSIAPIVAFVAVLFQRRAFVFIAGGLAAIAILFSVDCAVNSPEKLYGSRAVITSETIARKGIGKDYEAAFDSPLKDGAEFDVLQETNGWTFGHFAGIGDGWVRNEFVAR